MYNKFLFSLLALIFTAQQCFALNIDKTLEKHVAPISDKIASIQIINQLLEGIPFEDCDYIVPNGIVKCYIGEDWYLTKDIDGNIQKYIMSNSKNKELALEEINNILAKNKIRKR